MPCRNIFCGLGTALSVIVIAPISWPFVFGAKVIEIVQVAPGFTDDPQVLVWVNGPVATMLPMLRMP